MAGETSEAPADKQPVQIPRTLTVRELADVLNVGPVQLIKTLMVNGVMADVSKIIDFDTAAVVAVDLGFEPAPAAQAEAAPSPAAPAAVADAEAEEDPEDLQQRPPVVALLGHVDHGKTTLLDAIRQSNVAAGEAGGITQGIGAYQVQAQEQLLTFIDTPGHEAFSQMRAQGASATDIAVLVVGADDGVMPQTIESINHIHAANVPLVVALTKIDLPSATPDRVKAQLAEHEVVIEEYGGDVTLTPVSGVTGEGVEALLETIGLVAEIQELRANPDRRAEGVVLEAQLDRRQGPRTTLLVQRGTLRVGDAILLDETWGRVKAMFDHTSGRIQEAGPSTPVAVLGAHDVARAGDRFRVAPSERDAKAAYERAKRTRKAAEAQLQHAASLDALFGEISRGDVEELNLVLKTDVQGSVQPIRQTIESLSAEAVHVKVIHAAAGAVTESDVNLALAAQGIVLGFNTGVETGARRVAAIGGVEIRSYSVIYDLVEDIRAALSGLLKPVEVEVVDAHAEVLQVFAIRRLGNVAGCRADDGVIRRAQEARVIRDSAVIHSGAISSLRRFQDDVQEVQAGQEFGVAVQGYSEPQAGDRLEFFHREMQSRRIDDAPERTAAGSRPRA